MGKIMEPEYSEEDAVIPVKDDGNVDLEISSKPDAMAMTEVNNDKEGVTNTDVVDGTKIDTEDEILMIETDDENSNGRSGRLSLYGIAGKKTVAQGLMDIALITANANQLRYVLEFNRGSHTFHITVSLIIVSLTLQVAVAMFLIFKGRYYVKGESKTVNAKRVKSCVLFMIFLITVVNVFIASFTTMEANPKI